MQLYRHVMCHFVCSLKNYLTSSIYESWLSFTKDVAKEHDLDSLYRAHVFYLKDILFKWALIFFIKNDI